MIQLCTEDTICDGDQYAAGFKEVSTLESLDQWGQRTSEAGGRGLGASGSSSEGLCGRPMVRCKNLVIMLQQILFQNKMIAFMNNNF